MVAQVYSDDAPIGCITGGAMNSSGPSVGVSTPYGPAEQESQKSKGPVPL